MKKIFAQFKVQIFKEEKEEEESTICDSDMTW